MGEITQPTCDTIFLSQYQHLQNFELTVSLSIRRTFIPAPLSFIILVIYCFTPRTTSIVNSLRMQNLTENYLKDIDALLLPSENIKKTFDPI